VLGILLAVSVLLVPLGSVLFGNELRVGPKPGRLTVAALLMLAPLLALAAYTVWVLVRRGSRARLGEEFRDALMVGSLAHRGMTVTLGPAVAAALRSYVPVLAKETSKGPEESRAVVFHALDPDGRAAVLDAERLARRPEALVELARHVLTNLNDEWVSALRDDQRLELRRLIVGEQPKRQSEQARAALLTLMGAFAAT